MASNIDNTALADCIYRWKREIKLGKNVNFAINNLENNQEKILKILKKENARLRIERDLFKKAVADSIG